LILEFEKDGGFMRILLFLVVTWSAFKVAVKVDLWSMPEFSAAMFELTDSMYIHGYINVEVLTEFKVSDESNCLYKDFEAANSDFKKTYSQYLSEVSLNDIEKVLSNKSYYICWEYDFISDEGFEASVSKHSFISEDKQVEFQVKAIYAN
jgi:hypothetical protein